MPVNACTQHDCKIDIKTQNIQHTVDPDSQNLRFPGPPHSPSARHPDKGYKPASKWQGLLGWGWFIILRTAWASHTLNTVGFTALKLRMKVFWIGLDGKCRLESSAEPHFIWQYKDWGVTYVKQLLLCNKLLYDTLFCRVLRLHDDSKW